MSLEAAISIALRAVRELSLPDSCAALLLAEPADDDRERGWESPRAEREPRGDADCCRAGGSLRCASAGSLRAPHAHAADRPGTCRWEPARLDGAHHSRAWTPGVDGLSSRVPDVAMAPNGNTHLLTPRDYCRPPTEYGGVLQLDLGDGATHTPRPGSRAQRAAASVNRQREHSQAGVRARSEDDELRAAIELSVIRAYSSFGGRARAAPAPPAVHHAAPASRGSPSPSNSAHLSAARGLDAAPRDPLGARARTSSPRRARLYRARELDYRAEGERSPPGFA